jgi:hypothetical protein
VNGEPVDVVAHGRVLLDALSAALPVWVGRALRRRAPADVPPGELDRCAAEVTVQVAALVRPRLEALLLTDIDEQRSSPLALVREAVPVLTEALDSLGAASVARDGFAVDRFPGDRYDLTPATWADIDEAVAEPGLRWSAAKAFEHRRRHSG